MKTLTRTIETNQPINLYLFGDEHIGDAHADLKCTMERLIQCKADPNGLAICIGDIMNTATCSSVSDTYSELCSPMAQVEAAAKLFEPIKDKIIAYGTGNHEDRVYKNDGIDISYFVARELNVPYFDNTALIFLRFGNTSKGRPIAYSIYVRHGAGGGSKVGGKANRLQSNSQIVDADIYIQGHTHAPIVFKEDFFRTSWQNSSVDKVTHTFVNLGSSLDYGGYGEKFGFAPGTKVHPIVHLDPNVKNVTVTL